MLKSLFLSLFVLSTVAVLGQAQVNMPNSGTITTTACSGTLYDNAGPNAVDNSIGGIAAVRIQAGGNATTLHFTNFSIGPKTMYIYDNSFPRTLLHTYNDNMLPNNGDPIVIPSGDVTIELDNNIAGSRRTNFEMYWSEGSEPASATPYELDRACINFVNDSTTLSYIDSIQVVNTRCTSLNFSSIVATNTDITTSPTQLIIPPFDTGYVYVTYTPGTAWASDENIFLTATNGILAEVCVNGNLPQLRLDPSSINFNHTSIGCGDSAKFSFYIYNDGDTGLSWNLGVPPFFDDFEGASVNPIWQNLGANQIGPGWCNVRSGVNTLNFRSNSRFSITQPFYSTGGDSVTFWAGTAATCGVMNFFGLRVDYSTDSGATWVNLGIIASPPQTSYYAFHIPVTGPVQVRLGSTIDWDDSGIVNVDDFAIKGINSSVGFNPSSGILSPSDSILVEGAIDVNTWNAGTYDIPITINTNDPNTPYVQDTVSLTLNFTLKPVLGINQTSCVDFGNPASGGAIDSILVKNEGCIGDLSILGLLLTHSDFTATADTNLIEPGDSTYIRITFISNQVGLYNDTLTIQTNDTNAVICLTAQGTGIPKFDVIPDSIYVSATHCQDSVIVPITITNIGGATTLEFTIDSLESVSDTLLNITILKMPGSSNSYNSIPGQIQNSTVSISTATTPAQLEQDLVDTDVLVIAPIPSGQANVSLAQSLSPTLRKFASRGGGIIVTNSASTTSTRALGLFAFSISYGSQFFLTPSVEDYSLPILSAADVSNLTQADGALYINSPNTHVIYAGIEPENHIIALIPFGGGNVAYFGYNNPNLYPATYRNLISYLNEATRHQAYVTYYQDSVQVNDSTQLELVIPTSGLLDRVYAGTITIRSNDPSDSVITIPYTLDLKPYGGEMDFVSTCVDFDSVRVGMLKIDTATVFNSDACDTLLITSFSSSTRDYSIQSGLPISIAPGDSTEVLIGFKPSAMGIVSDTLYFNSSSGTSGLCVTGVGSYVPQLSTASDTFEVTLNCNNSVIQTYDIANTGQDDMNYDIRFGEHYAGQSFKAYPNVLGASTVHRFNTSITSPDSIILTVIYEGDFDSDHQSLRVISGNNVLVDTWLNSLHNPPMGTPDTIVRTLTGAQAAALISNGILEIEVRNDLSTAHASIGSNYHDVRVEVYKAGTPPSWLTLPSTTSGTLVSGATQAKSFSFSSAGLSSGVYNSSMTIVTNDPVLPYKSVPIIFEVANMAQMQIPDTCLTFPPTHINDTSVVDFWIVNEGCQTLNVTNISSSSPAFVVSPSTFTIPAQDSLLLTVRFMPTTSQPTYSSFITVESNLVTDTICLNGTVIAYPSAGFTYEIVDSCTAEVQFNDQSTGMGTSYLWDFGDGQTSQLSNPIHTYASSGTYTVTLAVSNSVGVDSISSNVTVNPFDLKYEVVMDNMTVTSDTLHINKPIYFSGISSSASTWDWDFGNGTSSSLQNPTFIYPVVGNFQVTLFAQDNSGCHDTLSRSFWVVDNIGLNENDVNSFRVYPNPSKGVFQVVSSELGWTETSIEVFNARGEHIFSQMAEELLDIQTVDLGQLPVGMYVMIIAQDRKRVSVNRLIKQ